MATSTIKGTQAKILETAAANQTYSVQMNILKVKYNTLGDDQKMRCVIRDGNAVYNQTNVSGAFARYVQGKTTTGLQWYGGMFDISDLTFYTVNNGTVEYKSNAVNANSLYLCLI